MYSSAIVIEEERLKPQAFNYFRFRVTSVLSQTFLMFLKETAMCLRRTLSDTETHISNASIKNIHLLRLRATKTKI